MSKIVFNYGVVGSRKSGELLLTLHRNREVSGKSVLVLQSDINVRDEGKIKSRALKFEEKAHIVCTETDIRDLYEGQDLIMIDEIQFFSKKHIDELVDISMKHEVLIFCYGLMSDFRANLFPTIQHLLPHCTKIVEIPTVCEVCGKAKATMNRMIGLVGDIGGVSVGNHYQGVCIKCFKK
ncbi:MAG: thymidine kinase [Fusobacteriaceae bacterium]